MEPDSPDAVCRIDGTGERACSSDEAGAESRHPVLKDEVKLTKIPQVGHRVAAGEPLGQPPQQVAEHLFKGVIEKGAL